MAPRLPQHWFSVSFNKLLEAFKGSERRGGRLEEAVGVCRRRGKAAPAGQGGLGRGAGASEGGGRGGVALFSWLSIVFPAFSMVFLCFPHRFEGNLAVLQVTRSKSSRSVRARSGERLRRGFKAYSRPCNSSRASGFKRFRDCRGFVPSKMTVEVENQ